jgi:hypothetical protein
MIAPPHMMVELSSALVLDQYKEGWLAVVTIHKLVVGGGRKGGGSVAGCPM